jgi:hypothetical protein
MAVPTANTASKYGGRPYASMFTPVVGQFSHHANLPQFNGVC